LGHTNRWINSLMQSLDAQVDEETRAKILENCGRNCISRSFIAKAQALKKNAKDMDDFLENLGRTWKHLQRKGEAVYVMYDKCYCPLVRDHKDKLSPTFCNCSRGWIKELFESILNKPIEVKLEKSIKQGDEICRFKLSL
jgi:predicted hydrocarbon binding protein